MHVLARTTRSTARARSLTPLLRLDSVEQVRQLWENHFATIIDDLVGDIRDVMIDLVQRWVFTIRVANVVLVAGSNRASGDADVAAFTNRYAWIAFEHFGTHVSNIHPFDSNRFVRVRRIGPFQFHAANLETLQDFEIPIGNDATTFDVESIKVFARLRPAGNAVSL